LSDQGESASTGEHTATARRERKRFAAEQRRQLQPLRNSLRKLEQEMARHQQQQQQLEVQLADNALYQAARKEELKQCLAEKAAIDRLIEDAEENWLEISEKLEAAQTSETY
jgi:ATP-binding cassette subfamily F protein 3